MPIQKQVNVPIAQKTFSNFPLYGDHVTTTNFMELNVPKCMELVPNESIKYAMQTYTRLSPLLKPTFGRAEIRNRHFFVPFRTVWPAFLDFIDDVPHLFDDGESSLVGTVPVIYNLDFLDFLTSNTCAEIVTGSTNLAEQSDFFVTSDTGSNENWYRFTTFGRWCYKILRSLGYSPVMDRRCSSSDSALPLMCLMKVHADWFFPSQYCNTDRYDYLVSFLERNVLHDPGESYIKAQDLEDIFMQLNDITYDNDYFTAAWDNPNSPNDGLSSSFNINDISGSDIENTSDYSTVSNTKYGDGTPSISNNLVLDGMSIFNISSYMLTALQSMSDYLKRHQLAGSRVIDRYLARHGIKLSSETLRRSILLGEQKNSIRFSDVTSFASTDGADLGDYAGKAEGVVRDSIEFTAKEYGMLISVSTIIPYTQYYQGINRHVKHIGKLDFWTEEYDALGTQAIYKSELYAPLSNPNDNDMSAYNNGVFGFTGRYGEYKVGQSLITGDYILNSRNVGDDAWTLFRDLSHFELEDVVHGYNFISNRDKRQYNRIFSGVIEDVDKFNVIHSFEIDVRFPGKKLFDTYEFKDEDKSRKVTMPIGGTTLS